jgi:hypothetical protein
MSLSTTNSASRISDLLRGYRTTQILHVMAKLGIADQLINGPRTAAELGTLVNADPHALYRLLRALGSLGFLEEDGDGRFALTELGSNLRSDVPDSFRNGAIMHGERWWWEAWGGLFDAVRTGRTAFDDVHKRGLFNFLRDDAAAAALFNACMRQMTTQEGEAIASAFDFSSSHRIVDVGGGHGALARAILARYPHAAMLLFDTPEVIGTARANLELLGNGGQCELVAGDFFVSVPGGGDTYILKDILHDWDDAQAGIILQNLRQAMPETARLLVIERIIPPGNAPSPGKLVDITMLVMTGGKERTVSEYRTLLTAAGFAVQEVIVASGETSIIVALPQ